jgi:hypothetical protein
MLNPIPGLQRGLDPTLPKQVLEAKLKVIDKRRAELEAVLNNGHLDDTYKAQELQAEYSSLGAMRYAIDAVLNPKPKPARHPALQKVYDEDRKRDVALLRDAIRQQTEQTEHAADKEEAIGNHRQARILRLTIPEIPEQVCQEFHKDLALLAEIQE